MQEIRNELRRWITDFNSQETLSEGLILPATNRTQLLKVLTIRYQPAHFFERVIDHLLNAIEQEGKGRQPLVDALERNLQEERAEGGADYGPAHVLGRRAFFQALGIDYWAWEAGLGGDIQNLSGLSPAAAYLVGFYRTLIETSPLAGGAGMLYWEGRIPRLDYTLLLGRVDETFGFPPVEGMLPRATSQEDIPARWHLQSHAEHDVYHEKELIDGVVESIRTPEEAVLVKTALLASRLAWDRFWIDLREEIF